METGVSGDTPNKRIKLARSKLYVESRSVSARSLCAVRSARPGSARCPAHDVVDR